MQDLRGPARAFIKRFDIDYPIVADGGSLVGRYGVIGYPETFFIDRKGCVVPPHIIGPVDAGRSSTQGIRRRCSRVRAGLRAEA